MQSPGVELVDTHCHLYDEAFDSDRSEMLDRARMAGVSRFYLPAIDRTSHDSMFKMEQAFPDQCFPMMGLHPCYVNEQVEEELRIVKEWLEQRAFCAVGEIGLDFYWDRTFEQQQYQAFEQQLEWSLQYKLPVSIHSRNATQESIEVIKKVNRRGKTQGESQFKVRGVFHCFSGSVELARQIVDLGLYLGIGGVITYKNAGLPAVVQEIGLEHLVLETDAPYLSPVPYRGKRNESAYLSAVVSAVAQATAASEQEVARVTTANAKKIFDTQP